jgi:SAM-dependent methyltransferase
VSTVLWVGTVQFPDFRSHVFSSAALLAGVCCILLTSANLGLRWFRWHFLIRHFSHKVTTRDSFAAYLSTLPAIATPFCVGELVRVVVVRKRFNAHTSFLVRVWLAERLMDLGVLGTFFLWTTQGRWGALSWLGLVFFALGVFRLAMAERNSGRLLLSTTITLGSTILAWLLPIGGLHLTLRLLGSPIELGTAIRTFSAGTLFGGATGLPLGVFVTGSTMIHELVLEGVASATGILAILVYRATTAWYAVVLGLVSLVIYRKRLVAMLRGSPEAHFDEIAGDYESEIPEHVRERLLERKISLIEKKLGDFGLAPGAHGLDLGCGQGWYLAALRRRGFVVDGVDYSAGQLARARVHLASLGQDEGVLVQADAQALPFPDDSLDFVYSINAMHHILSSEVQVRALREVIRVLRPGGVFVLHEINTTNPIFRLYIGYLFPLLKKIDEGTEEWLVPGALPAVTGGHWSTNVSYFTFLPDFGPRLLQRMFTPLERWLERSALRRFSAHYQACLEKPSRDGETN